MVDALFVQRVDLECNLIQINKTDWVYAVGLAASPSDSVSHSENAAVMQVSIPSITIPPRTPGDLHQTFAPPRGFCILAFAREAGICWDSSRGAGICL